VISGVERNIYGTSGILTNFKDDVSSSSDVDSWTITAPVGFKINVTVMHFNNTNKCKNIKAKDVLLNADLTCSNGNYPTFIISKQRVLQINITHSGDDEYFAIFTTFRKNGEFWELVREVNGN
jgi:hypothetical protein